MEEDFRRGRREVSEVFEVEVQAHLYIKRLGVYNRDPGRRDLVDPSVLEMKIRSWKKEETWKTMLQLADYNPTGDIKFQPPGRTDVKTNVPRVPREEALY